MKSTIRASLWRFKSERLPNAEGLGFTTNLSLRKANRKIPIIVKYPGQEFAAKLPQSIGLGLAFVNILLYVLKSSQEHHTQNWTLNTQCQSHSPKKTDLCSRD